MISDRGISETNSFRECIGIYEEAVAYLEGRRGIIASTVVKEPFWNVAEKALSKALRLAITKGECREISERAERLSKERKHFNDLYKQAHEKISTLAS